MVLRTLLNEGFNGVPTKWNRLLQSNSLRNGADGHLLGTMQNEWQALRHFLLPILSAPFVRVDQLDYEQVKQEFQSFVYR
jgi:ribonucleoside-triphosphate reductase